MKKVIALPNTRAIPKSGAYVRAWNHERGLALIGAVEAMKAEIVNDFLKG